MSVTSHAVGGAGFSLTSNDDEVGEMPPAILCPDTNDPLLLAVRLGDHAGEGALGISEHELDAKLLAEKSGVDAGLESFKCQFLFLRGMAFRYLVRDSNTTFDVEKSIGVSAVYVIDDVKFLNPFRADFPQPVFFSGCTLDRKSDGLHRGSRRLGAHLDELHLAELGCSSLHGVEALPVELIQLGAGRDEIVSTLKENHIVRAEALGELGLGTSSNSPIP